MILRRGSETLLQQTRTRLLQMFERNIHDRFILCLAHITARDTGYPQLAAVFMVRVTSLLPTLPGDFRWRALQILVSRTDTALGMEAMELWMHLQPLLPQLLATRDEHIQEESLLLIQLLLCKIEEASVIRTTIDILMNAALSLTSSTAQKLFLETLAWIYDNKPAQRDYRTELRGYLLKALSDDSEVIRKQASQFWSGAGRLDSDPIHRLVDILSPSFYAKSIESTWLGSIISLLLQLCEASVDYNRPLAEPLDPTIQFRAVDMNSIATGTGVGTLLQYVPMGMIRATQTPAFSLTQSIATSADSSDTMNFQFAFPSSVTLALEEISESPQGSMFM